MKRTFALLALFAGSLVAADLKPVDEAGYGKLVAGAKGKVVLVNFWATYCVPCRKEMPQLVALEAKLRAKGYQFVTISADEPEQLKDAAAYLDKLKVPAPVYVRKAKDDDKFVAAIDGKWSGALPASFLYDKTGKKVRAFFGEVKVAELEAAILKLL
ncbi:MAG: TlpA family protein disulfide reductase [Bryobacterales bacterium]|nr:TlpA family protein disulfide reductase [Bryobacterales bacterium]